MFGESDGRRNTSDSPGRLLLIILDGCASRHLGPGELCPWRRLMIHMCHHFRSEAEARIDAFRAANRGVRFGSLLKGPADPT